MKKIIAPIFCIFICSFVVFTLAVADDEDNTWRPEPSESIRLEYMAHLKYTGDTGWQPHPQIVGTVGLSKRMEGIALRLGSKSKKIGLRYRVHIKNEGDSAWCYLGQYCGTRGQGKRIESIEIQLTGNDEKFYDVYYTCHQANTGWTGWMKNGQRCGTIGISKRLEAFAVMVSAKPNTKATE